MRNKIKVRAGADGAFVSALAIDAKINLHDLRGAENGCEFLVSRKEYPFLKNKMLESGVSAEVVKDGSIGSIIKIQMGRMGLWVGLMLFALALGVYASCVTEVRVSGNERIESNAIAETVKNEMSLPTLKNNVDVKKLKTAVCLMEGIGEADVEMLGNRLYVTVSEELSPVAVPQGNLVSNYDSIVTSVIVYEGESAVKAGDPVKKGDVLIQKTGEAALGDVYGRVWFTEQIVLSPKKIVTVRTGKKETVYTSRSLEPRYIGNFSLYETETEEVYLPLAVPIPARKTVYYEVITREEEIDWEKEIEETAKNVFLRMEKDLPTGAKKQNKWFLVKTVDKMRVLDLYYEVEIKLTS